MEAKLKDRFDYLKSAAILLTFLVERVDAYMINNKMFELTTISAYNSIYRKSKNLLIKAYTYTNNSTL